MTIRDEALFHPHQPLQVPDGERRLGPGDGKFREVVPIEQRIAGGLDGVFGNTPGI